MRILLIAPPYLDLYKHIADELERGGHEVRTILQGMMEGDPYVGWAGRLGPLRRFLWSHVKRPADRYWREMIAADESLRRPFDLLFAIQGNTVCPTLTRHLTGMNGGIRKVLYLWDNCSWYDYMHNAHLFDRVMTFDKRDSINSGAVYLPFFIPRCVKREEREPTIDISCVGTDHDGRYDLIEKLIPRLDRDGIRWEFRILPFGERVMDPRVRIGGKLPDSEYVRIMSESRCVLDTDRESQFALTPRVLWALASGKKVATTNRDIAALVDNTDNILVIDRSDPKISREFLLTPPSGQESGEFAHLRVDRWISNILNT